MRFIASLLVLSAAIAAQAYTVPSIVGSPLSPVVLFTIQQAVDYAPSGSTITVNAVLGPEKRRHLGQIADDCFHVERHP